VPSFFGVTRNSFCLYCLNNVIFGQSVVGKLLELLRKMSDFKANVRDINLAGF